MAGIGPSGKPEVNVAWKFLKENPLYLIPSNERNLFICPVRVYLKGKSK
jgi:hypothetical protein